MRKVVPKKCAVVPFVSEPITCCQGHLSAERLSGHPVKRNTENLDDHQWASIVVKTNEPKPTNSLDSNHGGSQRCPISALVKGCRTSAQSHGCAGCNQAMRAGVLQPLTSTELDRAPNPTFCFGEIRRAPAGPYAQFPVMDNCRLQRVVCHWQIPQKLPELFST
jgi:hypothetical protein